MILPKMCQPAGEPPFSSKPPLRNVRLARFLGELVDADPIHEKSLRPDRRLVRGRQEVAADRRVDDQPHRRGEFRQEVSHLVVVERRVVHVVDVEPQLVADPLAGEGVKTVGVRYELVPDRRLLLDREESCESGFRVPQ